MRPASEIVSPEHFVAVRTLPGGPAPAPMAAALAGYRAQAAQFTADARTIAEREAAAQALAKGLRGAG
jgi:argininosuccinate lyase